MNLSRTKSVLFRAAALAGAALFGLAAAPASAQEGDRDRDEEREERPRGRLITIGAGAQIGPQFPGADGYTISPMPIVDVRRPGQRITYEAGDEGWGFGLLGREASFNIGPAVQFQGKRREEDVGAAVGNVGFTVEAGAFVEAYLSDSFRIRAEGRRGINGHEGLVGDVGFDLIARGGDTTVFGIGPRIRLADDKYMNAYFGVSPAAAVRTGLAAFTPDSGVYAAGGAASVRHHFGSDGKWGVHGFARYDRLVRDAADSPIVRGFGSRNQFSGGLGLSYTFRTGGARR
jgi:outer membrane protein